MYLYQVARDSCRHDTAWHGISTTVPTQVVNRLFGAWLEPWEQSRQNAHKCRRYKCLLFLYYYVSFVDSAKTERMIGRSARIFETA